MPCLYIFCCCEITLLLLWGKRSIRTFHVILANNLQKLSVYQSFYSTTIHVTSSCLSFSSPHKEVKMLPTGHHPSKFTCPSYLQNIAWLHLPPSPPLSQSSILTSQSQSWVLSYPLPSSEMLSSLPLTWWPDAPLMTQLLPLLGAQWKAAWVTFSHWGWILSFSCWEAWMDFQGTWVKMHNPSCALRGSGWLGPAYSLIPILLLIWSLKFRHGGLLSYLRMLAHAAPSQDLPLPSPASLHPSSWQRVVLDPQSKSVPHRTHHK